MGISEQSFGHRHGTNTLASKAFWVTVLWESFILRSIDAWHTRRYVIFISRLFCTLLILFGPRFELALRPASFLGRKADIVVSRGHLDLVIFSRNLDFLMSKIRPDLFISPVPFCI